MAPNSWGSVALFGLAAALLGIVVLRGSSRRVLVAAGATAAVLVAGAYCAQVYGHLIAADYPLLLDLVVVPPALVVGVVVAAVARRQVRRIGAAALAVPLSLVTGFCAVDAWFGAYPTWASVVSVGQVAHVADLPALTSPAHVTGAAIVGSVGAATTPADPPSPTATATPSPTQTHPSTSAGASAPAPADRGRRSGRPHGLLVAVSPTPTASHFHARAGYVWLPPAYVAGRRDLPVVLLLAGSPSTTHDWLSGGRAAGAASRYAAQHDGVAPVLVLADANGSATGDTECVDSHLGAAETYLTTDVPDYVRATFDIPSSEPWAVAGLSEGGECSAMLALRHPALFRAFGDYSGLTSPSVGNTVDAAATTTALFGGDRASYDAHDPLYLLAHRPPQVAAFFAAGRDDHRSITAQTTLADVAHASGLYACTSAISGQSHTFYAWADAFALDLPSMAQALGLPAAAAPPGCPALPAHA